MTPNASSAISTAAGSTLTRRTSGPPLGFLCKFADVAVVGVVAVPVRAVVPVVASAAEPVGAGRRVFAALVAARPEAERPAAPPRLCEPPLPPAGDRPPGAVRLGDDCGAPWAPWEPEAGVEVELASGERGECEPADPSPVPVCPSGLGSGGALTGGVLMLGVLSDGTLTVPTVTDGVVTAGTVIAGTLIVGVETLTVGVETLIVGVETLTVGTLIVGTDASEDAAATSSAPQTTRAATTRRRKDARTGH
jgi:hypothetical protein